MLDYVNTLADATSACEAIPAGVANVVSLIVKGVQVVVPILLIIWGMLDFAKAVIGSDEDKIKAAQKVFIKRLIAAVIVFLVVTIVKLVVNLVGQINGESVDQTDSIWSCVSCFTDGTGANGCPISG